MNNNLNNKFQLRIVENKYSEQIGGDTDSIFKDTTINSDFYNEKKIHINLQGNVILLVKEDFINKKFIIHKTTNNTTLTIRNETNELRGIGVLQINDYYFTNYNRENDNLNIIIEENVQINNFINFGRGCNIINESNDYCTINITNNGIIRMFQNLKIDDYRYGARINNFTNNNKIDFIYNNYSIINNLINNNYINYILLENKSETNINNNKSINKLFIDKSSTGNYVQSAEGNIVLLNYETDKKFNIDDDSNDVAKYIEKKINYETVYKIYEKERQKQQQSQSQQSQSQQQLKLRTTQQQQSLQSSQLSSQQSLQSSQLSSQQSPQPKTQQQQQLKLRIIQQAKSNISVSPQNEGNSSSLLSDLKSPKNFNKTNEGNDRNSLLCDLRSPKKSNKINEGTSGSLSSSIQKK